MTKIRHRVLGIFVHPAKLLTSPATKHYYGRYHEKYKFPRAVFAFDIFLLGLAFGLALTALILIFFKPNDFANKIVFDATVAPTEIITGAPSTLVIRYKNLTGEELRNARLALDFPKYFVVEEISKESGEPVEGKNIELGIVPIGGAGSARVRGVMFGDVGGEQIFKSAMTFNYGKENKRGYIKSDYKFSPTRSALALKLKVPEKLISYQTIEGEITYANTGTINFPEMTITPQWPNGFLFLESSAPIINNAWKISSIAPSEEGKITFRGRLGEDEKGFTHFIFSPSFVFGEDSFAQETLTASVATIPSPIKMSHTFAQGPLEPGKYMKITVRYENTSDKVVKNLRAGIEADGKFFETRDANGVVYDGKYFMAPTIAEIKAGENGEINFEIRVRKYFLQSEFSDYENIKVTTRAIGSFIFEDAGALPVESRGADIATALTSPILLESFGRYFSAQGDQIGRGPLPPVVGGETKFWIFWNIASTTNALDEVVLRANLNKNASFTGKQSVSIGEPAQYDAGTRALVWRVGRVEPTFAPGSRVAGIAFEVVITPTEDQVGTSPELIGMVELTARDSVTGSFVNATGAQVTTNLSHDSLANGMGVVEF